MFWKKQTEKRADLESRLSENAAEITNMITEGISGRLIDSTIAQVEVKIREIMNQQDSIFALKAEKQLLEEEVAKLKSKARLEETEFKALIKLREDRQLLELEKKSVAMEKEFNKKEMELLKKGHEQHIEAIDEQSDRLDKFMKDAMDCLKSATKPASTTVVK